MTAIDLSLPDPQHPQLTHVDLTWIGHHVEHRIRFGHPVATRDLDETHRTVSFAAGAIFARIRWAANNYGTRLSRIDIVRACAWEGPFTAIPYIRPGGELLLHIHGWPKVQRVLALIERIEALNIDPALAAPEYWRHVHNRLIVGQEPRAYSRARHLAWRLRQKLM